MLRFKKVARAAPREPRLLCVVLPLSLVAAGAPLPQVEVAQPLSRVVSDYEVFTGR